MTTPFLLGSYLTVEEFRAAPTALQTNNLVPGADQTTQDAELAGLIGRASRWIDSVARQPLYATRGSQNEQARVSGGDVLLHAHQDHVKALDTLAWGTSWTSLSTVTNPTCFIEEDRIRVALAASGTTWQGNLSALCTPTSGQVYVQWSYTAGWVTTRLTNPQSIGDTVLMVDNPAGVVPGVILRMAAGAVQNTYTVASVTGSAVTLTTPLVEGWAAGSGVAETPDDIKEACVLATSHYIKMRKGTGLVMAKVPTVDKSTADELGPELGQARELAQRYQRLTP